jgi:hypothetical protein
MKKQILRFGLVSAFLCSSSMVLSERSLALPMVEEEEGGAGGACCGA